jgi:hypothetical protein
MKKFEMTPKELCKKYRENLPKNFKLFSTYNVDGETFFVLIKDGEEFLRKSFDDSNEESMENAMKEILKYAIRPIESFDDLVEEYPNMKKYLPELKKYFEFRPLTSPDGKYIKMKLVPKMI